MLMKKLLLSLLAVAGMTLAAVGEEVKFDFVGDGTSDLYGMTRLSGTTNEYNTDPTTVKDGAVSIKLTGNTRLWANGLRFYKGSAMEISAEGYVVTGVTFGSNHSKFNYEGAALTSADWTGNAAAVSFSCNITKGNTPVSSLTVTIEPTAAPAVSKPVITTVEGEECFVATITCATEGADIYYTIDGTEPTAASDKYTAPVEMWGVNQIKAIAVKGDDKSAVASATVPLLLTDASMFGDMESGTSFILKTQMTAIYQNGSYLYAKAGWSGNILIYGNVGKELSNGDTFTRLEGKYSPFNNLPEIVSPVIGEVTTGGTPVEPFEEATSDLVATYTLNYYLSFKDVKVDAWSGPNSTLTDADGNTVALYNQLKLPETELLSGDKCTVTGFVGIYKTNLQFYPIKIETASSGIEGITADENTPVEYYNLQGIRVANPAQGSVVIRRQGSHVSKVIVR